MHKPSLRIIKHEMIHSPKINHLDLGGFEGFNIIIQRRTCKFVKPSITIETILFGL